MTESHSHIPSLALNDGRSLPAIGLGTYPLDDDQAATAVGSALSIGYRLIDTAAAYGNEAGVGRAISSSVVPRGDIVVTTKLPGRDHGFEATLESFDRSRSRLGLEYVDLYLIHWPLPRIDRYVQSWRAMIRLRTQGLIRSIGVSNFTAAQIERLEVETGVLPAVNQIELHPHFPQTSMLGYDRAEGIVTQSWSPLGRGNLLGDETITAIAAAHQVSPAPGCPSLARPARRDPHSQVGHACASGHQPRRVRVRADRRGDGRHRRPRSSTPRRRPRHARGL